MDNKPLESYIHLIGKNVKYKNREGYLRFGTVGSIHVYISQTGIGCVKIYIKGTGSYIRFQDILEEIS